MKNKAYVIAGGTGGHINAAVTLGKELETHDYQCKYISGQRHLDYQLYKGLDCLNLPARPLVGKSIHQIINSLVFNSYVFLRCFSLFLIKRPRFVIGCGGYICGPTLLAAKLLFIPIFILEQNSVLGFTNKVLSKISNIVFTCFDETKGLIKSPKVKNFGNPIRQSFYMNKRERPNNDVFRLLIFGGSLGAIDLNELLENLIKTYDFDFPIYVRHQTGKGKAAVKATHEKVCYESLEYIDNMFEEYMQADLVICRGGASTITELQYVKRPSLIIPIQFHADQHQVYNAQSLASEAEFPVHIGRNAELMLNNCEKLKELIKGEYQRDKANDNKWYTDKPTVAQKRIIDEILKYV